MMFGLSPHVRTTVECGEGMSHWLCVHLYLSCVYMLCARWALTCVLTISARTLPQRHAPCLRGSTLAPLPRSRGRLAMAIAKAVGLARLRPGCGGLRMRLFPRILKMGLCMVRRSAKKKEGVLLKGAAQA